MKYTLVILIGLFFSFSINLFAQQRSEADIKAFQAEKEKIIMQEANLTQEEARLFFPLYHEMSKKRFEVNRDARKSMKLIYTQEKVSDADYQKAINNLFKAKEVELELEKEYYAKFRQILPAKKVFQVSVAEAKMTKELLKKHTKK